MCSVSDPRTQGLFLVLLFTHHAHYHFSLQDLTRAAPSWQAWQGPQNQASNQHWHVGVAPTPVLQQDLCLGSCVLCPRLVRLHPLLLRNRQEPGGKSRPARSIAGHANCTYIGELVRVHCLSSSEQLSRERCPSSGLQSQQRCCL